MDHFAGLAVSVKETSICIVDETGRIVRWIQPLSKPLRFEGDTSVLVQNWK